MLTYEMIPQVEMTLYSFAWTSVSNEGNAGNEI